MEKPVSSSARPTASILLINYNGWDDLSRCLPSLLADTLDRDYEILIVDNGSSDDSPQKLAEAFPQVRLIRNDTNAGFGGGNNLAASQARGEYLAFLNPDTVVEQGWLEPLLDALRGDARIGMATSKVLLMSETHRINACGNVIHLSGLTLCRGAGRPSDRFVRPDRVSAVSGAAFAMRKDLFFTLGGFDDTFFMYVEDTDLSLRVQLAGYAIQCIPASVVYHDYRLTFGPLKTYYQERNRYLMLLKDFRLGTLIVLGPALLLAEIVSWGFVFVRERGKLSNKLEAYGWVLRHMAEIRQAHRQVQGLRKVRDREVVRLLAWQLEFEQTGEGFISWASHLVFDPVFWLLKVWALALVWW